MSMYSTAVSASVTAVASMLDKPDTSATYNAQYKANMTRWNARQRARSAQKNIYNSMARKPLMVANVKANEATAASEALIAAAVSETTGNSVKMVQQAIQHNSVARVADIERETDAKVATLGADIFSAESEARSVVNPKIAPNNHDSLMLGVVASAAASALENKAVTGAWDGTPEVKMRTSIPYQASPEGVDANSKSWWKW